MSLIFPYAFFVPFFFSFLFFPLFFCLIFIAFSFFGERFPFRCFPSFFPSRCFPSFFSFQMFPFLFSFQMFSLLFSFLLFIPHRLLPFLSRSLRKAEGKQPYKKFQSLSKLNLENDFRRLFYGNHRKQNFYFC